MKHRFSKPIFLIVPALLALLAVAALYLRLYQQIGSSAAQARLAEDIIQTEQNEQDQAKNIQGVYQSSASERAELPGLFVPSADEVAFIEALESIGPASGATVSIASIKADPLDNAAPGTTGKIETDVTAHGSWDDVMKSLVMAESLPYQNTVDDVVLTNGGATSVVEKSPVWQISYHVSALIMAGGTTTNP